MRNILIIFLNFYRQVFDNPRKYLYFLGLPILSFIAVFLLFGKQDGNDIINLGVINSDKDILTEYIISEIEDIGGYSITYIDEKDIEEAVIEKSLDAVILFPKGLSKNILKSSEYYPVIYSVENQGLITGLKIIINDYITNYFTLLKSTGDTNEFNRLLESYSENGIFINRELVITDDNGSNIGYRALGFLLVFLFSQGLSITALILKNRENKTYYRLLTSPISELSYFLGNMLAGFIILAIQTLVGLISVSLLFSFNFLVLFPILLFFSLMTISLGLLVTSLSKSQQVANNIAIILVTPLSMLGGCFWSVSWMPQFMQRISLFVPQYWAMDGIEKLTAGSGEIWINILIMSAFSLLFLALFIFRTKTIKRETN